MRTRRNRRTSLLAAGGLLLAGLAPGLMTLTAPAQAADEDTTFTVAVLTDVDSFNPFVGIKATSFEMWALTYDYLISYSMEDMSPEPGLAESWDTSDDGLTWTFHLRDDAVFSDGEPLTSDDVVHTFSRIMDGGPEAATWGSYLTGAESVTATDPQTVELTLKKPLATLPLLPIPIVPEHIWKDVSEKDVKTYKAEPENGEPVVGSGPFRLVSGEASGATYEFDANPDYWGGAPHIDHVVFRVYKSEDPMVAALKKGEVDFVDGITPLQVQALEGEPGITAQNGDSPGFDEIAFNVGAEDPETGEPLGDGNPALQDPAFRHALGWGIDLDQLIERVYQGAGKPGTTIVPPAYPNWQWVPSDDELMTYDPEKAGQLLDEAGYAIGDDGLRTMPDGSPIGTLRLFARSDSMGDISLNTMDFFKEWLADLGIESEVTAMQSNKLTDVILEGELRRVPVGLVRRAGPDLDAQLHDLRPARQLVGLLVLQRGVRRPLRGAAGRARRRQAGRDGQADAADALRGLAVPRDGVQHHRRGVPQRPVRLPGAAARTRAASGCSSTAPTTTRTCGWRTRRVTAAATPARPRRPRPRPTTASAPACWSRSAWPCSWSC